MEPSNPPKQTAKELRKAEREAAALEQTKAANIQVNDVETDAWGYLPSIRSTYRTQRQWVKIQDLTEESKGRKVWLRSRLQENRCKGAIGFVVLRNQSWTVQGVLDAKGESSKDMIKWVGSLPLESVVDVYGLVTKPDVAITGATQQVELQVLKLHCVSKASPVLPFQLRDANNAETELEDFVRVSQDTRLDNRILDLRTLANQAIFRISSQVCTLFREALLAKEFVEIHSPKLVGGTSEGGSNVFRLEYFGRPSCLAQSPQLYKQMCISADFDRVFEIAPVFRAENSNTHRHLCEFVGLDMEMAFKEHYEEVLEVLEYMFTFIFKGINERCQAELAAVCRQYPFKPFEFDADGKVLRLDFADGVRILRDANVADIPEDTSSFDLSTTQEKELGRLVKEKYKTDFYYMVRYPLKVRPFYTMPCADDGTLSNSYDWFMRGEEIVSGAQRIHDPVLLTERAKANGIDVETIKDYIDAFTLGAFPHGGAGIGLERVVMLFMGLNNIRKSSLFPRDPKRLTP